ncbi:MAG: glycosyl transferase family 2 [Acidobacteriales bacterium]|nr:glycosyl transferase family 2 [Terriglobales bacterium]
MTVSVAIITKNEEANIRRTLESVRWADEVIVVDSGSTDATCDIARELGAKVFTEDWKGFAAQKNSAIDKCTGDWILSLDADEEVSEGLRGMITRVMHSDLMDVYEHVAGVMLPRKNLFLGRWIKYGGFYPDRKLRLFRKGTGQFKEALVHETIEVNGGTDRLDHDSLVGYETPDLIHHAYPTLSSYIEHMNSYSSLGAEMAVAKGQGRFSILNIVVRPLATLIYNYFLRLGFLDGREGLLLHLYHSVYVSWKYAKAWEKARSISKTN